MDFPRYKCLLATRTQIHKTQIFWSLMSDFNFLFYNKVKLTSLLTTLDFQTRDDKFKVKKIFFLFGEKMKEKFSFLYFSFWVFH